MANVVHMLPTGGLMAQADWLSPRLATTGVVTAVVR